MNFLNAFFVAMLFTCSAGAAPMPVPKVSGVDQRPTLPANWGKCTGDVEQFARDTSNWCKFNRLVSWPGPPTAAASKALKFGRQTIYRGGILKQKSACNVDLVGSDTHATVAVSTKYLKTSDGGWAVHKGACGKCVCVHVRGADIAYNVWAPKDAVNAKRGLCFMGRVGDREGEGADESIDILQDRPYAYAPNHPHDNPNAYKVNRLKGLRGFDQSEGKLSPEYTGTWAADWHLASFNDLANTDVMVMCDKEYSKIVRQELPNVDVHIVASNPDAVTTSMRKIEIFGYERIHEYEKVLYLDSDIAIVGDVLQIFEHPLENDVLYVKNEGTDIAMLDNLEHGLDLYTSDDLTRFEADGQHAFNAGHFLFANTSANRLHFDNILRLMRGWDGPFFYEQSFLNHYFQMNRKYDDVLLDKYVDFLKTESDDPRENDQAVIVHCLNCTVGSSIKLHNMKYTFNCAIYHCRPMVYRDSRHDIADVVSLPARSKMLQIGAFEADFARTLLDRFQPQMLFLSDSSADRPACYVNITFLRTREDVLELFPDGDLDFVYIDGGQSQDARVLDLAFRKVKHMGWICGRGIMTNPNKTNEQCSADAMNAVKTFCYDNGLRVECLFMDPCVSYAIRLNKPLHSAGESRGQISI